MYESFKQMLHTDVGWEFPQAAVVVCESWSHSTICKINLCENLHTSTSWNIWFHQFIQAELRRWFFFSQVEPLLLLWKGGYFVSTWVKRGFLRSAKVKPRNGWIWPPRSKRLTSQHSLAKIKRLLHGWGLCHSDVSCLMSTRSPSGLWDGFHEPEGRRPSQMHRQRESNITYNRAGASTLLLDESFEMIIHVILLSCSGHAVSAVSAVSAWRDHLQTDTAAWHLGVAWPAPLGNPSVPVSLIRWMRPGAREEHGRSLMPPPLTHELPWLIHWQRFSLLFLWSGSAVQDRRVFFFLFLNPFPVC